MNDLCDRLAQLAATGRTVTYGALARDLGWSMGDLTAALERLMEIDAHQGHPLRAAVCEGRLSGGLPARGFFEKAASLGYDVTAPESFAVSHRRALLQADASSPTVAPRTQT
ncbi:hypothetical protein [Pseudorhodobacter sp. MZDSW-24AT]|uniref:hypothetical protein n=1 Tax=Pseudorhodobacter sp. MZDSW-24AT TaxID=2052957 RepID=UPI000C1F38B8|nr:hypothetical protein [Pseudorhodobacter sp. MZDSW-24AT]PJF10579.1 hypothetical protein CUR21_04370 [Pseudorhodobacter sp. MZDSW-24AT]